MDSASMKVVVGRYYEELWSQGRLEFVDEHMAPDYENHDPATPGAVLTGRDAFRALVVTYREAFPDLRFEIVEQHADGDTVVSRWFASGTHRGALMGIPPTGKRAPTVEGITLTTFAGGKIVRDRVVWDTLGLLRGLGAIPG